MNKTTTLEILEILQEEIGYKIELIETDGWLGKIKFDNKKVSFFSSNVLPINGYLPAYIANDKAFTRSLLEHENIKVPKTEAFFREDFAEYAKPNHQREDGKKFLNTYFKTNNSKIVIKPNKLHSGKGVFIINNIEDALEAYNIAFSYDYIALIQEYVGWEEYRLIYLENEFLWGYKKTPGKIIGNGKDNTKTLLEKYFNELQSNKRLFKHEDFIQHKLAKIPLEIQDNILKEGELYFVEENVLNLSLGAELHVVDNEIDEAYLDIGRQTIKSLNLTYGAVDIKIRDIKDNKNMDYAILELNSNPLYRNAWELGYKNKVLSIHKKILQKIKLS